MARKRNDIHRTGNFTPADYDFVAMNVREWEYLLDATSDGLMIQQATILKRHMEQTGGTWSQHEHGGSCMVCGAHANYLATFYHRATNTYICTGMDCAAKAQSGDKDLFRRINDARQAASKARTGRKKAEGTLAEKGLGKVWDIFLTCTRPNKDTYEGILRTAGKTGDLLARAALRDLFLDAGLDPAAVPVPWGNEEAIIVDIVEKLIKWGSLSDRQYDLLTRLARDIDNRPAKEARAQELAEKRAAEKAKADDVPEGRHTVEVEVLKTEWKEEEAFGYGRPNGRWVMTVKSVTGGWTAHGTIPASVVDVAPNPPTQEDPVPATRKLARGDRLDLTATFKRKPGDSKFAFFSRPIASMTKIDD